MLLYAIQVYFHSVWNLFDFMVALGSVIEMIIRFSGQSVMDVSLKASMFFSSIIIEFRGLYIEEMQYLMI